MNEKETLESFLDAWRMKDTKEILKYCQKTWVSERKDKRAFFNTTLFKINVVSYDIQEPVPFAENVVDIDFKLTLAFDGNETTSTHIARLIKESAPYHPDKAGRWGVNPVSIQRTK